VKRIAPAAERCDFHDSHGNRCARPRGHDPVTRAHVIVDGEGRILRFRSRKGPGVSERERAGEPGGVTA
jgi:hypothetical protein